MLFDCYQRQSIKAMTKSQRSKNIPQIVGRVIARREVPLQVFLALGDKKAHLAEGLEGYFRDSGFDQNTVRESGKR